MQLRIFLFSISFIHTIWCYSPPQITSDSPIQSDDVVGDFIEINEGEDISLQCSHPQGENVRLVFPSLEEYKYHDPDDYALRRSSGSDEWADSVIIKNAKMTDTGLYACVINDEPSIAHHVYVFVNGSKLFIPLQAGGYSVDPYTYAVPCKASRNVDRSKVLLNVNGEHWKAASKKYDPRFGFNITEKVAEHKLTQQLMFTCIYPSGNETLEFFIGPRADNSGQKIELEWGEVSQWTYVGGELAIECILKGSLGFEKEKFKHKLNMTCPRCGTTAVSSQTRVRTRGMAFSISIHNVTNEDRGQYFCNRFFDEHPQKSIEMAVEVSTKKGQIKINNVSATDLVIRSGETFSLYVNMSAFPYSLPGFSAKWMRHYIKPPKEAPITESIITDPTHVTESKQFENQIAETLTVRDAKTNSSGIYVLSIQILDTVKTVEFKVSVLSNDLKPKIQITTPESYVILNQIYYAPGTQIGVLCSAESIPLPSVVKLSYRIINNPVLWDPVPHESTLYLNGTYESAIQWDTVINQTMDVKCEARSETHGKTRFELMRIKVADGEPRVSHTVTKSALATPLEDGKDIYEGDDVILNCTYPKDAEWEALWKFNGADLENHKVSMAATDVSNTLNANLRNIAVTASGEYSCVPDGNPDKALKIVLTVLKTVKPYYTDSDSETPLELKFGQEANLSCHLEGLPKPQIYWFKDGESYSQGILKDHNRTLYIPRVALEDSGKFICRAVNRAGEAEATFHTTVSGEPKKLHKVWLPLMSLALLVLMCGMIAFGFVIFKQRKTNREQNRALAVLYDQLMRDTSAPPPTLKQPLDQSVSDLPYNREFEVERDMLMTEKRIGAGQFGQVWTGVLKKSRVSDQCSEEEKLPVAVKVPLNGKDATQQKMLADELKIMCAIGKHPNVLALVGAVTKNMKKGELFVIVELCENGNLKEFLAKRRTAFIDELRPPEVKEDDYVVPDSSKRSRYANELDQQWSEDAEKDRLLPESSSLTTSDLLSFAMQVANGMEYLSSLPCIHRDLAARNVLLTSNFVCRIADFGMARHEHKNYYKLRKSKNVPVPYRWMSIEAIEQGMFTVESDMWSYGILLYEIFTLSGMPYPTIANEDLLDKLKNGYRNSKPNYCHEEIYQLMQQCWQEEPAKRPTFTHCVHMLKSHLERSSPQLMERVEKSILEDVAKQNNLSKWIAQDVDYREHARHALARQEASRAANGENIYLHSY